MAKMSFSSPEFAKEAESLNNRATNLNTATQRSSTPGMSDFNKSQQSAADTSNYALSTNPLVQRSMAEDDRNFTEDARRFNAGLGFKNTADSRANETQRYGIGAQLDASKYNADAGVKQTQIGADANRYGADRNVDIAGLQTDASKYGAERGYQAAIYGADRGVDQARIGADAQIRSTQIGADANRFSALLGAGTATLNSQQYRPTFNR